MDTDFKIKQFEKFYYFLMKEAPKDYTPWFFPCSKNDKNPYALAIINLAPPLSLCCNAEWKKRLTKREEEQIVTAKEEGKKEPKIEPKWRCDECEKTKGSWHMPHARLTKEQVIEHIRQGYNIGLSARTDDALIIIDIDEEEYLNQVPKETLIVTSRKRAGLHAFCWDKDGSAKKNIPTDFGEIRSDNQYVLACGSYVPFELENEKDKKAYEKLPQYAKDDELIGYYTIKESVSPREIDFNGLPDLFKDKVMNDLEEEANIKNRETQKEFTGEGKYSELFNLKVSDIVGLIPANKRQGHPLHESDTDANFSLTEDGSLAHCWRHLVSLNAVQYLCVKAEYRSCVDCGTPHKQGISKIKGDKEAYKVAYDEAVKLGLIKEYVKEIKEKSFLIDEYNKKTGATTQKVNIEFTANHLKEKYNFRTIYGEKTEKIYIWEKNIFTTGARGLIKSDCEYLLGSQAKKHCIEEIYDKVKRKTKINQDDFERTDLNLIPLQNGIWDIQNKKLIEHDPKYNFRFVLTPTYDEKAKCPNWLKFINEALYPADIPVMQEWFGFNLFREYFIKKAVICFGEQDTGKTILLDTLIQFVGEKNKAGLSLQKIASGTDFNKLTLKDKHSNVHDDLSSKDVNDGGAFKVATGGGWISGEEKFGEYSQFKSFAKQTLAGNKIPPVKDNDDLAYFGRWIVFKFDNVPDKLDPFLRKKIHSEEEISGIFNWSLEGLYRILENGKFSYNKSPEEIKKIMELSGDPLIQFGEEVLNQKEDSKVSKENMYQIYSIWANKTDKPMLTKEQLGRRLNQKIKYLIDKREAKIRSWGNCEIKSKWFEDSEFQKVVSQNNERNDTLDTSKKSIRNNLDTHKKEDNNDTKKSNIIFSKASKVSQKEVDFEEALK